ncbi:MAG TPA: low molecular weight protein-tyrosine-phosphatase [Alphaproteobacteria bacterium]|nr:low molecular weight protein-tyrosine-phosphatase [Alphaproteobacteria bacterium]
MEEIRNILFVCTGNICRSPMAEAVMRRRLELMGWGHLHEVGSAATHSYHLGERPDHRTLRICYENGVNAEGIVSRVLTEDDFKRFDLILGMDRSHVDFIKSFAPKDHASNVGLFMEFGGLGKLDVPDPYYGNLDDFLQVYEMVSKGTDGVLEKISRTRGEVMP